MSKNDKALLRVVKRQNKNCLNKVVTDMKIRNMGKRKRVLLVGIDSESPLNCRVLDRSLVVED